MTWEAVLSQVDYDCGQVDPTNMIMLCRIGSQVSSYKTLASTTDKWPALSRMLEGWTGGPKILMPELQNIKIQTGTYNIIYRERDT